MRKLVKLALKLRSKHKTVLVPLVRVQPWKNRILFVKLLVLFQIIPKDREERCIKISEYKYMMTTLYRVVYTRLHAFKLVDAMR